MSANLRISAVAANQASEQHERNVRHRAKKRLEFRENTPAARNYIPLRTMKFNYLNNLEIKSTGDRFQRLLMNGVQPQVSDQWIENPTFYSNALEIGRKFVPPSITDDMTYSRALAEFMSELERLVQRRILNREFVTTNENNTPAQKRGNYHAMARTTMNLNQGTNMNITTLNDLTTRFNAFDANFWENQKYKEKWSADFRNLIDDTMRTLFKTFGNSGVSHFGALVPALRGYVPDSMSNTPTRRRPKGYIYKMDQNSLLLRSIFNIMMIRFPCINTNNASIWKSFSIPLYLERRDIEAGDGVDTAYLTTVTVEYTDSSLQNLFYYIPEQERVVGIWPNLVRASKGAHQRTTIRVNYNCQMVRSVMCKIRMNAADMEMGSRVNFNMLFENEVNNLYTNIRKTDIFNFGQRINQWARYYVSMTFFSETNDKLMHIPWTIESTSSPFNSPNTGGPFVPYDISELLRVISEVLERKISGRQDENEDGTMIFVIIQFITEFPLEHYNSLLHLLDVMDREEEEEEDGLETKSARNVRRRVSRTPQQASPTAPTPLSGMLVGAPYAGTEKERHFLTASMINRFTLSDALFETPQRQQTYSCFMMSVIRCQMYMYVYDSLGRCTNILATNAGRDDMSCQGKIVEAVMDYSQCSSTFPFIKKENGQCFIHLFNNVKYTQNGKYMSGCRSEEEIQYWEMCSDEIWIHLERFCEREINYNDIGDYGQVFADFFRVCICIYDIEYRGNRICVISPDKKSPKELAMEGEILMIHLVFDQGHIHPINNLRSFIRSKKRKTDVRINHYCPICDKKQTDALTSSKESSLQHITECTESLSKFQTGFQEEKTYREQSQIAKTSIQYTKKGGKLMKYWECNQCHQEVNQLTYQSHVCYIQSKKPEEILDQKIYVWDVEAAQIEDQFHLLKHECNCIYIRRVYTDDPVEQQGRYFPSEVEFVDALLEESEFQNSIFVAHNSGSYDIHFLLRIFERCEIDHTYTPSPTSKHKFIMVQLTDRNVKFLDFIRFMPGSLKNIAESFKVPVAKGDFPHRFNNGCHDSYVGRIPAIDSEHDYWGLKEVRSKKQKEELNKWYQLQLEVYCSCSQQCTCNKKKWDFQEEIRKYCLLDVVVLAAVVKAYRDKVKTYSSDIDKDFPDSTVEWHVPCVDPFQFMTLPQITMQTLIRGYRESSFHNQGFKGIVSYCQSERETFCPESLLWLKRRAVFDECFIMSRENSLRDFYEFELKMSFDGYCYETNTVYVFLKCSYWGCPHCYRDIVEQNDIVPGRGLRAEDVRIHYELVMYHLNSNYKVVSIWQHDFQTAFYHPYLLNCINQMTPSDCFYGGRTEVFKLYCNSLKFPEDEILYYDVTSLYPSVYAQCVLPIGSPNYYIGYNCARERLDPNHPERYFGYVRIKIRPPNTDRIGLLPQRDKQTQRLTFPVHPMEGCWFTEEVYLAMENGYVVEEIYEVYHWNAYQRSDQYLRGYVGFFLRMKQESEGWKKLGASSDTPSPEEQEQIADALYIQNGHLARIRPSFVKLDPVMRALAKLFLNSLWGKWAQKQARNFHTTVYGQQQLSSLIGDTTVERSSLMFRNISPGVFKVNYKKKSSFIAPVAHGNIFIAAAVTAWARITLHRQMLKIGSERIIYCDTDSIIFRWPKNGERLSGIGLGKWTDEYPGNTIVRVYALAPKLYALTLGSKEGSGQDLLHPENCYESFRAKGIQMTLENQTRLGFDKILPLIKNTLEHKHVECTVEVNNFNIFTNSTNNTLPFGNLFSRYNTKKVRVIITKRTIEDIQSCDFEEISEINTYPPGYLVDIPFQ